MGRYTLICLTHISLIKCKICYSAYISQRMKEENPFKKTALQRLYNEVESYAKFKKLPLALKTKGIKDRNNEVVAKTFHGAGIVVPVDDNDVGYRPLPDNDGKNYFCCSFFVVTLSFYTTWNRPAHLLMRASFVLIATIWTFDKDC